MFKSIIKLLLLGSSALWVGCSAKVMTYDQHGRVVGSCKATAFLTPLQGIASCYGYAHDHNLSFAKRKANEELELLALPDTAKIQLNAY